MQAHALIIFTFNNINNMEYFKTFFIALIVFFILDSMWLGYLANSWYIKGYGEWLRLKNGSLQPLWPAAIWVYLLFALAITIFVIPLAPTLLKALLYGAILGFIIYGVYDLTNLAVFKDWPVWISIVDIVWGGVICGLTSLTTLFLIRLI